MKKLIGMIAIASVFSVVMMGCQPPAEGDTATAPDAKTSTPDAKAPTTADGAAKTTG